MKAPRRVYVLNWGEYVEVVEQVGPLLTPGVAATLVGVRRQKLYDRLEAGRLTAVLVAGQVHVVYAEVGAWWRQRQAVLHKTSATLGVTQELPEGVEPGGVT